MSLLRTTAAEIRRDVAVAKDRDPAAVGVSALEILLTWPGVQAVLAYRVAHALQNSGVPLVPRMIATLARTWTGVEIHPAAKLGPGFFIDHGMGVVIGETAEVGADVTVYQGVTLGGTGFVTGKRHPTVEDNVTIGANTVVIHNVPPNSTVVGIPGHPVRIEGRKPEGPDADWVHLPDPIADAVTALSRRLDALEGINHDSAALPLGAGRGVGPNPAGG
jgi:serine O-acetyltransferase